MGPVFKAKIIVTLIIKVPIMTNVTSIHNNEIIGLLDEMCDKVHGMAAAFVGATDMMVSDYDGNQPDAPVKYKCIYCKFSATRNIGVERLLQTIPQWHSTFGNVPVFWDATMQMDNKPQRPRGTKGQRHPSSTSSWKAMLS